MGSSIFPIKASSRNVPEAADTATNIFGKTVVQIARDTPEYGFTEFITLKFRRGIQLEDDTTDEGRIWANTVKTYLAQDGVGPAWWGRTAEDRDAVQLVVGRPKPQTQEEHRSIHTLQGFCELTMFSFRVAHHLRVPKFPQLSYPSRIRRSTTTNPPLALNFKTFRPPKILRHARERFIFHVYRAFLYRHLYLDIPTFLSHSYVRLDRRLQLFSNC